MNINKKKYPLCYALSKGHLPSLLQFGAEPKQSDVIMGDGYVKSIPMASRINHATICEDITDQALNNIQYICEPIYSMIEDNEVEGVLWKNRYLIEEDTGILIAGKGLEILYNIDRSIDEKVYIWMCVCLDGVIISVFFVAYTDDLEHILTSTTENYDWYEANDQKPPVDISNINSLIVWAMKELLVVRMFLQTADVEVKTIDSGKKAKIKTKGKVLNKLPYKVQMIDHRYFTTIVRTEGFKVKGHPRLQPHGEGNKKRKLIFIAPYSKNGYTRKATKLQ